MLLLFDAIADAFGSAVPDRAGHCLTVLLDSLVERLKTGACCTVSLADQDPQRLGRPFFAGRAV